MKMWCWAKKNNPRGLTSESPKKISAPIPQGRPKQSIYVIRPDHKLPREGNNQKPTLKVSVKEKIAYQDSNNPPPNVDYGTKPRYPVRTLSTSIGFCENPIETSSFPPPLPQRPTSQEEKLQKEAGGKDFNWELSGDARHFGVQLVIELIKNKPPEYFEESHIQTAVARLWRKETDFGKPDRKLISHIWNMLCPTNQFLNLPRRTEKSVESSECGSTLYLATYFLLLYKAANEGKSLPTHIPLGLRVRIDFRAQQASSIYKRRQENLFTKLFSHNKNTEAINVAIFLELIITHDAEGLKRASDFIKKIIQSRGKFEGFRLLDPEDLSNLLVTFVWKFLECYTNSSEQPYLQHAILFFTEILSLSDRTPYRLFEITIAKLNGHGVPLCLALFLEGLNGNEEDLWMARKLYKSFENYYNNTTDGYCSNPQRSMAVGMIVMFLCLTTPRRCLFLMSLHNLALKLPFGEEWGSNWDVLDTKGFYHRQCQIFGQYMKNHVAVATLHHNGAIDSLRLMDGP